MKVVKDCKQAEILSKDVNSSHIIIGHMMEDYDINQKRDWYILLAARDGNKDEYGNLYRALCLNNYFTLYNSLNHKDSPIQKWLEMDHMEWYAFNSMKEACEFLANVL